MILLDAGPMIAILDAGDRHHEACVSALETIREPLLTVWPAITEAMFLLESAEAQAALIELLESEAVAIAELSKADLPRIGELMLKYNDLPMDLADAALVRVAEREHLRAVFTIDRRDFEIYRPSHVRRLRIIP
jgi:uncharacterized protein